MCLYWWDHTINQNDNEDEMKNRSHRYDVGLGLDMGTNIENITIMLVWWC